MSTFAERIKRLKSQGLFSLIEGTTFRSYLLLLLLWLISKPILREHL
jgi:hypothetical protein